MKKIIFVLLGTVIVVSGVLAYQSYQNEKLQEVCCMPEEFLNNKSTEEDQSERSKETAQSYTEELVNIPQCDDITNKDLTIPRECQFTSGQTRFIARITTKGVDILSADKEIIQSMNVASLGMGKGDPADFEYWEGSHWSTSMIINVEDSTFDGYEDLMIMSSSGAYNLEYALYPFVPATGTFMSEPGLSLTNPLVDVESKTVSEFLKGRGIADMYVMNEYRFENGKYVLIKTEEQDVYEEQMPGFVPLTYKKTITELINGTMVITSEEIIPAKEIWGDQ